MNPNPSYVPAGNWTSSLSHNTTNTGRGRSLYGVSASAGGLRPRRQLTANSGIRLAKHRIRSRGVRVGTERIEPDGPGRSDDLTTFSLVSIIVSKRVPVTVAIATPRTT